MCVNGLHGCVVIEPKYWGELGNLIRFGSNPKTDTLSQMTQQVVLPLRLLPNLLPVLEGVYVHPEAPLTKPTVPGPYRALVDTGSSHSWVKPTIRDLLRPHSLEGYVLDRGDGVGEDLANDVKSGFMKGLQGKPVQAWVQLDRRLTAFNVMLLSGDFDMGQADAVLGMDYLLNFVQCGLLFRGLQTQSQLVIEDNL